MALESINDPGNLGAIIRIADWYGIEKILCSSDTVDFYNPKVIAASMGSFLRVQVQYGDLSELLKNTALPVLGAFLDGTNVHKFQFPTEGILVIGSEAHGISPALEKIVTEKITIPRTGKAESLNAAIATAIICDNWLR